MGAQTFQDECAINDTFLFIKNMEIFIDRVFIIRNKNVAVSRSFAATLDIQRSLLNPS